MIEKIVYSDIDVRFKMVYESMGKINNILDKNINLIKRESELEAKIDDILAYFKPVIPDLSPISKNGGEPTFEKANNLQITELQYSKWGEILKCYTHRKNMA